MPSYKLPPPMRPKSCVIVRRPFSSDENLLKCEDSSYILTDDELYDWLTKSYGPCADKVLGFIASNSAIRVERTDTDDVSIYRMNGKIEDAFDILSKSLPEDTQVCLYSSLGEAKKWQ